MNIGVSMFKAGAAKELEGLTLNIKYAANTFQASMADSVIYLAIDGALEKPVFASMFDRDAYVLILCHELGHAVGGSPYGSGLKTSIEGQADHYAAAICAPKVFADTTETQQRLRGRKIDPDLVRWCARHHKGENEFNLCLRIGTAALTVAHAHYLNSNGRYTQGKINTPDCTQFVLKYSFSGTIRSRHPSPQCRLDTYMRGIAKLPASACWNNDGGDKTTFFEEMDAAYGVANVCQKTCASLPPEVNDLEREQRCLSSPCTRALHPMIYSSQPMTTFDNVDHRNAFELAARIAAGDLSPIREFIDSGKSWCEGPKKDVDCVDGIKPETLFKNCAK